MAGRWRASHSLVTFHASHRWWFILTPELCSWWPLVGSVCQRLERSSSGVIRHDDARSNNQEENMGGPKWIEANAAPTTSTGAALNNRWWWWMVTIKFLGDVLLWGMTKHVLSRRTGVSRGILGGTRNRKFSRRQWMLQNYTYASTGYTTALCFFLFAFNTCICL